MNQNLFIEVYLLPIILLVVLLLSLLFYLLLKYRKTIQAQEEKIAWLREVFAKNEHRFTQKEHKLEKKILSLNEKLNILEKQQKDGTKNQVVNTIEALQSKREKQLKRANITLE